MTKSAVIDFNGQDELGGRFGDSVIRNSYTFKIDIDEDTDTARITATKTAINNGTAETKNPRSASYGDGKINVVFGIS